MPYETSLNLCHRHCGYNGVPTKTRPRSSGSARSAAATIRELGYPSHKNLTRWYRTFVEAGDLPAGYRSRPRYSAEQSQIAVEHYLGLDRSLAGTQRLWAIRGLQCSDYRRIRAALGKQQVLISENVARRLMRQEGLAAGTARRRRYGSYQGEIGPAPENHINLDFRATEANKKRLADITEFQLPAGKVFCHIDDIQLRKNSRPRN